MVNEQLAVDVGARPQAHDNAMLGTLSDRGIFPQGRGRLVERGHAGALRRGGRGCQ